jgi:AraC-like DNA-binding protein
VVKKQQGFPNEYLYVLPANVLNNFSASPILQQLYLTDIGFYPAAAGHYVHRKTGAAEWILIFCTQGRGKVIFDDRIWPVTRGTMVLLPPGKAHTYYADDDQPWDIFWVHFSGNRVGEYLPQEANSDSIVVQTRTNREDMAMLMSQFWEMIRTLSGGFSYTAVFYAAQILSATLAYLTFHSPQAQTTPIGNEHVTQAIQYVYDHLDSKLSLHVLATQINVSPSYLNRVFQANVGSSVTQFVTKIKLQQAEHYLIDSTLSVQQIAQRLGFTDPYYFSRVFKRNLSISPRAYRNQHGRRQQQN